MSGRIRRTMLAALAAAMMLGTSGCMFKPVEELYALPALPQEYSALQTTIQSTIDELGAEYATINYGSNTSTVQLLDMDGDGSQEYAAVFLRVTAAEEKPLRVCLFRRGADGEYRQSHIIQGDGTSINSVVYEDLTGDGVREVVVSWQMSSKVHILSAYELNPTEASELMSTTYNESYLVTDLNEDGVAEIMAFQQNSTGEGSNRAEYYCYQDGGMAMASTAPLSDNLRDVLSARMVRLSDGARGVYVTSEIDGGMLTDILVLGSNGLHNVTRDVMSGVSHSTLRSYTDVGITDINGDGVLEIPLPMQAPSLDPESTAQYYILYWRQFDRDGNSAVNCTTYHAVSDGWYMILPDGWPGRITVSRDDSLSGRGERAVVFYYCPAPEEGDPKPFLTVYRLTGNNRQARAKMNGRTTLYSDSSTIYAAVLNQDVWECGVELQDLIQRFYLITAEWSSQ